MAVHQGNNLDASCVDPKDYHVWKSPQYGSARVEFMQLIVIRVERNFGDSAIQFIQERLSGRVAAIGVPGKSRLSFIHRVGVNEEALIAHLGRRATRRARASAHGTNFTAPLSISRNLR